MAQAIAGHDHGSELHAMDRSSKTLSLQSSSYGHGKTDSQPQVPLDLEKIMPMIQKVVPPNPNILPSSDVFGDPYEIGDMYDPLVKRTVWEIKEYRSLNTYNLHPLTGTGSKPSLT